MQIARWTCWTLFICGAVGCLIGSLLFAQESQQADPATADPQPNRYPTSTSTPYYYTRVEPLANNEQSVNITYTERRPVHETIKVNGRMETVTRYHTDTRSVTVPLDTNLEKIDLPPNGKLRAILAVTSARHDKLLMTLRDAEGAEQLEAAAAALKENYTAHYEVETWWRKEKLAELEERIQKLRAQVDQRESSQTKYIDAAMTIASLWADGIATAPPKPNAGAAQPNTFSPYINPFTGDSVPQTPPAYTDGDAFVPPRR